MRMPLLFKMPGYLSYRWFGWPKMAPISLTISITNYCNHRCKTCDVYDNVQEDLTLEEYEKLFRSVGKGVYYLTVSGGEPFLRADIRDICRLARIHMNPKVIIIPTNGLLTERVPKTVAAMVEENPDTDFVINLSLDGVGSKHDFIRGKKGAYERALATLAELKAIGAPNLTVGIHTVVSRYNVNEFEEIHGELAKLDSDSLICEVAENREELFTTRHDITPDPDDFDKAVKIMLERMAKRRPSGLAKLLASFRVVYYRNAARIVRHRKQHPPCQAGTMLAHVSPSGEVWNCCVEAKSFGSLRENDHDFGKVYFDSPNKKKILKRIHAGECECPLANVGYVNILFHPPSIVRVIWNYLTNR